jgi:hypothetical protein
MNARIARLYEYGGALLVLLIRIVTAPRTPWENDEFLFAEAVRKIDLSRYHPHPPGFPLFVLLGKAFDAFLHDPWRALVVLNIVLAPIGFVALARALRHWIDDEQIAVAASLIYFLSASMLLHGPIGMSDAAAMTFVALAFAAASAPDDGQHERSAILLGIWTSAAIGVRPPLVIPVAAFLAVAVWRMRTQRQRLSCAIAFVFVSVMWFVPLLDAAGSFGNLMAYESKQAVYFATHDAAMSRGAHSLTEIAIRFVLHPWGSKYLTLPLIALIILGARRFAERWRVLLPLIALTAVQLFFEIISMDPADAARYSLPAMVLFALVAAIGLDVIGHSARVPFVPIVGALLFALGSYLYVHPIIAARTHGPSPVVAAAEYANAHFAPNTVVLYDLSLRPHAEYLMSRFHATVIEKGLSELYDRPDVPLVLFVNSGSAAPESRTFSWPASDAYGKLTRGFYREVTLEPMPPARRFLPVAGVYALERDAAGNEWRWLAPAATIRLPRVHGPKLTVTLTLSHDAPYDSNRVDIFANNAPVATVNVTRQPSSATIGVPSGANVEVRFVSHESFAPAAVLHNQDPRTLAVQLLNCQ